MHVDLKRQGYRVAKLGPPGTLCTLLAIALAACSAGHRGATGGGGHDTHWGYAGNNGPDHWADLNPDYALCRSGTEQSPIDLTDAVPVDADALQRRIGDQVLDVEQRAHVMDIVDNGHTIQVTIDARITIRDGQTVYELAQYHFHAPSEHTVNGEHAPLEAHFVHKSAAGELAVIGVLIEAGEHNAVIETIIAALPDGPDDPRHLENLNLDTEQLRPVPRRFYRYMGSLTTPPCSESVRWFVMADRLQVSAGQLAEIVSHLHNNNRPLQPLGERTLGLVSNE